jgi:hypothetical protein
VGGRRKISGLGSRGSRRGKGGGEGGGARGEGCFAGFRVCCEALRCDGVGWMEGGWGGWWVVDGGWWMVGER